MKSGRRCQKPGGRTTSSHSTICHRCMPATEATNPSRIRLLIVEDDVTLRTRLRRHFQQLGYQTATTDNGETAIDMLSHAPGYDLAILDLVLPCRDGWSVLEAVRRASSDAACLVLSTRTDLDDRLRCFRLGADDVVEKPFHLKELQARAEAILRRKMQSSNAAGDVYVADDLTVDFAAGVCYRRGEYIPLTAVEFNLLKYLIEHRGRAVPRDELAANLWNSPRAISPRTIDRHIATIRKKVEDAPATPRYVQTIYGEGYRFMPTG